MSSHHAITPPQHRQTGASRFNSSSTWLSQPILRASFDERVIGNSQRHQIGMMLIFQTSILNASINKYTAVKIRRDESLNPRTNVQCREKQRHKTWNWWPTFPDLLLPSSAGCNNLKWSSLFTFYTSPGTNLSPLSLARDNCIWVSNCSISKHSTELIQLESVTVHLWRIERGTFWEYFCWLMRVRRAGEMVIKTICIGALEADWGGPALHWAQHTLIPPYLLPH